MVSQEESVVTLQPHPGSDGVTVNDPVPPAAAKLPPCGFSTKLQAAPLCVIVRSAKPPDQDTRIAPVRGVMAVFAAAVHVIVPGLLPEVVPSVIQGVEVDADHEQTSPLVAVKLKLPPPAGMVCDVTDNV
jgi:hypothetical protein